MKVYDNYEITPCKRYEEPDSPGKFYFEPCEPHAADVWTLYGHIDGEGVQAIGDFATREAAEEVYARITGQKFTASYEADPRLRVMHAAPAQRTLLELLRHGLATVSDGDLDMDGVVYAFDDAYPDWTAVVDAIGWDKATDAIAQAEGRAA